MPKNTKNLVSIPFQMFIKLFKPIFDQLDILDASTITAEMTEASKTKSHTYVYFTLKKRFSLIF